VSECEKRFGDWRIFNPLRDRICELQGISTAPPPPPALPTPAPPAYVPYAPAEVVARQIVTVKPPEAPAVAPEIIVRAPLEVEITADDWREFRKMGDVNMNGVVDQGDIEEVRRCFGQLEGTELWSVCAKCDLNGDGYVGTDDVYVAASNLGLTVYAWKQRKTQR